MQVARGLPDHSGPFPAVIVTVLVGRPSVISSHPAMVVKR